MRRVGGIPALGMYLQPRKLGVGVGMSVGVGVGMSVGVGGLVEEVEALKTGRG